MSSQSDRDERRPRFRIALPLLLLLLASCRGLVREGPQLLDPPEGLGFTDPLQSARKPLPHRAAIRQMGYAAWNAEPPDIVVITEYEGEASREEILSAREEFANQYRSESYSAAEPTTIGGFDGWIWTITQEYRGELWSRDVVALVAGRGRTYSVEYSAHGAKASDPAAMKKVVASFRVVGRGATDLLVYALAALAALGLGVAWNRIQKAPKRS
jgi:hypothetical protein